VECVALIGVRGTIWLDGTQKLLVANSCGVECNLDAAFELFCELDLLGKVFL
jgi:hypothetical protein